MLLVFFNVVLLPYIIQINFRVSWTNKQSLFIKTQGTNPTFALVTLKNLGLFFIVNYVDYTLSVSCGQQLRLFVPGHTAEKNLIWILNQLVYIVALKIPYVNYVLHSNCQIVTLRPVNKIQIVVILHIWSIQNLER